MKMFENVLTDILRALQKWPPAIAEGTAFVTFDTVKCDAKIHFCKASLFFALQKTQHFCT